jgi:hypothetical protein
MKTKFTISNDYGQLNNEIDLDLTPEEMLDLMWIVMVTIHELDINQVRMEIELMRQSSVYYPETSEDLINVQ